MDDAANLVTDPAEIAAICRSLRRVAVLGIKPESHASQPAHYVPAYLAAAGVEVVPVPVYYPDVTEILGAPVFRRVADLPGAVDAVNVFRRPQDLMPHLPDLLAAKPPVVWLQLGITHEAFERELARSGIRVVADRCLMVEHRLALRG
jgi:predicted CoA-binding protein